MFVQKRFSPQSSDAVCFHIRHESDDRLEVYPLRPLSWLAPLGSMATMKRSALARAKNPVLERGAFWLFHVKPMRIFWPVRQKNPELWYM